MDKFNLLECTLRDGGYITGWHFDDNMIKDTIKTLIDANLDFVEVGYLNNAAGQKNMTQFKNIDAIIDFLPEDRKDATILAMADVLQFKPEDLTPYDGRSIDAIRVVFPRGKASEGLEVARKIREKGYRIFCQAANTLGYTDRELLDLIEQVNEVKPEGISVVDTFGAMACEMEGAAIAQVCYLAGVPCAILRAISDSTDDNHSMEFETFLSRAVDNSFRILMEVLK